MRVFKGIVFFAAILLSAMIVRAQSVSSVYSNNGVGILNYQGLPHNMAMGEVGIGAPSTWNLNLVNPAFLPLNSVTMYQVGAEMDRRQIANTNLEGKKVAGGLRYMNLGFPVILGKWNSAFGITPYSTVNNRTFSEFLLTPTDTAVTVYDGIGGISSLHWSNGFALGKNLFFGMKASYLFGSIKDVESTYIDTQDSYLVKLNDRASYSGMKFDLSAGYRKFLNDERILNFGLVYELSETLKGTHDQWYEYSQLPTRFILDDESFRYDLPSSVSFGMSYQKLNKWTIAADLATSSWSNAGGAGDDFENTVKIGVGAQYTPDYSSVNSYLKRVTYRFGVNSGNLPYSVNGENIKEVGINFGASLPVGLSNLDIAMKYGRQGSIENDLVRETYFRIVVGASINDRWFIKRRYD